MRFQRVIEAVFFSPWLITETGWASVERLVLAHVLEPRAERPKEDYFGDELPVMTINNGVAVIPVVGVIGQRLAMLDKQCGATDINDLSDDLDSALANPKVHRIVLDVDSPGGTVSGVPEVAAQIATANKQKRVDAFTGNLMCSAAYYLSAGCRSIYATPSATVGSIGVYLPVVDRSEMYKAMGVKVELIKSGKYKGMGFPGTSLSDEQRALLQADVDQTHADFKGFVSKYRTGVSDDSMEGQTFNGRKAADLKLVTGIRNSLQEVLAG